MLNFIYKLIPDWFKAGYYNARRKKPFSMGYTTAKFVDIKKNINDPTIIEKFKNAAALPKGYGESFDERAVEYSWAISKIPLEPGSFLDAGSALNVKEVLNHSVFDNKKITILNLNPEPTCFWQKGISYVFEDLRNMPFKDNHFDCITCVSTLEHVGMDNTPYMNDLKYKEENVFDFTKAILELKRVLKNNGKVLITVPFGAYQNYGWFQQFDSNLINKILTAFQPSHHKISYYKYEKNGWDISDGTSCKEVKYLMVTDYDSGMAQAIACLELVK
ncbi:methyltransferase domain-containing protein [Candidatus Parcubacteria bacterium]|nr:methyltransferase domain-containing protein [Candidatus Parcubacteria bacterium]